MAKVNDLTGQKFNKLTVLYRTFPNTKSGNARWHCQCECGNECDVVGTNLKTGHTKSCGCNIKLHMSQVGILQGYKNIENLNGQTFGKLTVIDRVYDIDSHKYKCLCECECGGRAYVSADKLKSGHTKSCGCLTSYGEEIINTYLAQHNILYKTEISFDDLRNPKTNRKLRFDFGIYDKHNNLICLIEYNGKQHYDTTSSFYTEEGAFRDKLKLEYCDKNNIKLIIFTYDSNIYQILDKLIEEAQLN